MNNIFLIHGEDDFLAREKLSYYKNGFIKKYGDLNISVYTDENIDLEKITNDLMSTPFLSEKKMVILDGIFSALKKDDRKKIIEKLENIPESSILFFFENKNLEDKKNRNADIDGLIKKIKKENIFDFNKTNDGNIISYVQNLVKKNGYQMEFRAINTLLSLVGPKTRQINQEMKKLMAYKHAKKSIETEDVLKLVKSQVNKNVFDLTDTLSKKDFKNAKLVLTNLIEAGENPISILGMITSHFRNLLYIKIAEKEKISKEKLISETKMHPFVYQKTFTQSKNFTLNKLKEIYQEIGNTDIAIKTGEQEGELALDLLIGKMCL